jgi:hypothetical protein
VTGSDQSDASLGERFEQTEKAFAGDREREPGAGLCQRRRDELRDGQR